LSTTITRNDLLDEEWARFKMFTTRVELYWEREREGGKIGLIFDSSWNQRDYIGWSCSWQFV
jgi:hypothetical protein